MLKQSQPAKIAIFFLLTLTLTLLAGAFVYAQEDQTAEENRYYTINLDAATIARGYTVSVFDNALKLSLTPGILNRSTGVDALELNEKIDGPWQLERISEIYQFEFKNKSAYDGEKPFYIQLAYDQPSDYYKQVYFYDKNYLAWRPLPTVDYPAESFVRSVIHLPFARLAVFVNPAALVMGKASWYKYKGGLFAASPDFPRNSRLRVFNLDNDKFVDVTVNDFGPDRKAHPDRVIDLDAVAFKRLASVGAGIINTRIQPLEIMPENGKILAIAPAGAKTGLELSVKSALAMNEQSGEILWQKNATSSRPLASLTKLVAAKVFLDTRPTLNRIVAYSAKDEEYNYQWVNKWESARLRISDGETLTVEDLLYVSLVGSANNTVESLVRVSGIVRDEFIARMNQEVKSWGASSTSFVEPTGLSPENVSTALDYAIITKEVYANPIIQKASTMARYEFSTINTKKAHTIKNTDKLLSVSKLPIIGSKTGYLDEAQYCLMLRADGGSSGNVIVVTMGAESKDKSFAETEDLLRYGLKKISGKIFYD